MLIFAPLELEDRKAMYLVGDFDYDAGRFFPQTVGEVDWGLDYYAPQVFKDDMGRTLMMGWMESWSFHPWYLGNAKNGRIPTAMFTTVRRSGLTEVFLPRGRFLSATTAS